ncbi:MAG: B12-binding domain-containing radical SAM protein [Planctomycetota bacterium]
MSSASSIEAGEVGTGGPTYRHVLCVYPYRVELSRNVHWPPLGLELIAAALRPFAGELDVVDLRREAGHTVDFLRPDTDLVCFSVNWDKEGGFVGDEIRSVPPGILTMVGGRHASNDPERWLSGCPNVDIVVRGDGEEAVVEIARGRELGGMPGVSFRQNGKLSHGPPRLPGPVDNDLFPDRAARRYVYTVPAESRRGVVELDSVAASRGCPFNCKFCSFDKNPWGAKRNWSARSPESVVRELEQVDARHVIFVDDNFTHDMDRVGEICDLLMERGIRKRYVVNARVEIARRPDVLRKMERAGFSMLLLGIESAQDRTLKSMRKGFDTKRLREYFRVLGKSRMFLHGYFILGCIGETEEEMLEIAPFARELGLDSLGLCLLRNAPFSGLDELVASTPGYHISPVGDIYSDEIPIQRLRQIRRQICKDFYYDGDQVWRMVKKILGNRVLTLGMLARLPGFLLMKSRRWRKK